MEDKTIEELQAELEGLKKAKIQKDIANLKADNEAEELKKKEEDETKLREQIRNEEKEKVLKELSEKSNIVSDKPIDTMAKTSDKHEKFKQDYMKKHGLKGLTYEQKIKEIVDGGY